MKTAAMGISYPIANRVRRSSAGVQLRIRFGGGLAAAPSLIVRNGDNNLRFRARDFVPVGSLSLLVPPCGGGMRDEAPAEQEFDVTLNPPSRLCGRFGLPIEHDTSGFSSR